MIKPRGSRRTNDQLHINFADAYGYRGDDLAVYYLSPWEFTARWSIEYLKPPSSYAKDPKTTWTEAGLAYRQILKQDKQAPPPKPGEHYIVIESSNPEKYISYPQTTETTLMRDTVVMVRRPRPFVPRPNATPLPTTHLSAEERCRIFSVYLRPWVLSREYASAHVPHLQDIDILVSEVLASQRDLNQKTLKKKRLRYKQSDFAYHASKKSLQYPTLKSDGQPFQRSYANAWINYRSKHVVSKYAAGIIRQFAASHLADSLEAAEEGEGNTSQRERLPVDNTWMTLTAVHDILRNPAAVEKSTTIADAKQKKESKFMHQIEAAKTITDKLWHVPEEEQDIRDPDFMLIKIKL